MSSRDKILKEVAQNKPPELPLPDTFFMENDSGNPVERFLNVLHSIGGVGRAVNGWDEVQQYLQHIIAEEKEVVNGIKELLPFNAGMYVPKTAVELQNVHAVFLRGNLAVAENAAIWLPEANMVNRALPFICEHLVLVVKESDIVGNMHQAYAKVNVDEDGYGVFIAGPSKTADIEQSLVIGAHGPLSLQVFVIKI